MTRRFNLQHQKLQVWQDVSIYNIKNYRYDKVKNFAGKKYLMKEWLPHSTGAHPGRVILRPCSYPEENKRKQKAAALLVDLAVLL